MRQFASGGFRIWNLSREAKIVYTGFGVFAVLAIAISMLFYEDLVGGESGVRAYYAGQSAAAPAAAPAAGGPKIELPDEREPPKMVVAVTYRKLLEVTHFHLFTVPVFLLIIAHLFMLTAARAKAAWIAAAWVSSLVHLGAPWLIRYASASWSWLYPASGALMGATMLVLTVYPIVVMWRPRPQREESGVP
jgi:hypothetical protein